MSTTSDGAVAGVPLRTEEASAAAPSTDLASLIPREIERLANAVLAQWPFAGPSIAAPEQAAPSELVPMVPRTSDPTLAAGPAQQVAEPALGKAFVQPGGVPGAVTAAPLPPPRLGPSALNVGSFGASPAVMLPPIPGPLKDPPLAVAPPPRESDLRSVVSVYSENVHGHSAVPLLTNLESGASGSPYFLDIAGLRDAGATNLNAPSVPGLSGASPWHQAPDFTSIDVPRAGSQHVPAPPSLGAMPLPHDPPTLGAPPVLPVQPPVPSVPGLPAAPPAPDLPGPTATWMPTSASPSFPTHGAPTFRDLPASSDLGAPEALPYAHETLVPSSNVPRVGSNDIVPPSAGHAPQLLRAPEPTPRLFDPQTIKADFPILRERIHGKPLVWLDNGATTQKPQSVIDRISYYYEHENSNIHRAAHTLAARSTDAYEGARDKVHRFINTSSSSEVIFTRGTTESINLVAQSWGRKNIGPGDEILITWLEHHANIVPWQMLAAEKGARLRVAPVDDSGQVRLDELEKLLGPRTRMVAITQVSNALGTIVPVREVVQMAHRHGATTLVDGAQAVSHMRVDVRQIDCDFYVFSGHKLFAPTGIGALYGKREVLDAMPPWQGGGNMIADVTFDETRYQGAPWRFEAGTGSIADAVGLGAAIDYVTSIGIDNVSQYEHELLVYGTRRLAEVPGLRMIGTAADKAGVMSFVLDGVPTEQIGAALDRDGIAVRAGHHCAQPILRRFGVEATVRATLAPYNTCADLDCLVDSLKRIVEEQRPRAR